MSTCRTRQPGLPINWNGPEKTAGDAAVGVVCHLRPRLPSPRGIGPRSRPPPTTPAAESHRSPGTMAPRSAFWTPTFFPAPAYFSYNRVWLCLRVKAFRFNSAESGPGGRSPRVCVYTHIHVVESVQSV